MSRLCAIGTCCTFKACIAAEYESCKQTSVDAGTESMHLTPSCAIADLTVETIDNTCYISDIVMNDDVYDPIGGCADNKLYKFCVKAGNQGSTFDFNYNDDGSTTRSYAHTLTYDRVTPKLVSIFGCDIMSAEVIVIECEVGTGLWFMSGISGGLRIRQVTGDRGTNGDNPTPQSLVVNITGNSSCQRYIFDTDLATTNALIASISATCEASVTACDSYGSACTDEEEDPFGD